MALQSHIVLRAKYEDRAQPPLLCTCHHAEYFRGLRYDRTELASYFNSPRGVGGLLSKAVKFVVSLVFPPWHPWAATPRFILSAASTRCRAPFIGLFSTDMTYSEHAVAAVATAHKASVHERNLSDPGDVT